MKNKILKLKYDNIFLALSFIFLGTLFLIYSFRFVYFYTKEKAKHKVDNSTFKQVLITNHSNLLKDKTNYYYYGKNPDNYVSYSGILFRIVSINNDGIKMISEESLTSLVMAYDDVDYQDTYVNMWLNKSEDEYTGMFQNVLKDKERLLSKTKICVDTTDDYNVSICKNYNKDYTVGLLSIDEYMRAGANNSYLNNGEFFWLSNKDSSGNYWYVSANGALSNKSKTKVDYYTYGVRPTITLGKDVALIKGTGTKDDPYIILENQSNILINQYVGTYIEYGGFLWRIIGFSDDSVKLAMSENEKDKNGEDILKLYDLEGSKYYNSNFYNYLNNSFYVHMNDTKYIVPSKWYDGSYNESSKFDYRNIYTSNAEEAVGTLAISDMFLSDVDGIFLLTPSTKKTLYTIQNNKIFIDDMSNKLKVRPVIYIKGMLNVSGSGTKDDPFKIEGEVK